MDLSFLVKTAPNSLKCYLGGVIPVRVTQCITYRCNLNCSYCSRHNIEGGELGTDEVKSLIISFKKFGTKCWSFNGGEALLRRDLPELIDFAKECGMYVSLASNGTLVKEKINSIKNLNMLTFSVDGPKKIHDKIRCNSFDSMWEGINAAREKGIETSFMTVLSKNNLDYLDDILNLAEETGSKSFFQPIRMQKEDLKGDAERFYPEREDMENALKYLIKMKKEGRPIASSEKYLGEIIRAWPDKPPNINCWGGRSFAFITPDGRLAHCCDTFNHPNNQDTSKVGAKAFKKLGKIRCETCFSAIPVETNIIMENPFQAVSFIKK